MTQPLPGCTEDPGQISHAACHLCGCILCTPSHVAGRGGELSRSKELPLGQDLGAWVLFLAWRVVRLGSSWCLSLSICKMGPLCARGLDTGSAGGVMNGSSSSPRTRVVDFDCRDLEAVVAWLGFELRFPAPGSSALPVRWGPYPLPMLPSLPRHALLVPRLHPSPCTRSPFPSSRRACNWL